MNALTPAVVFHGVVAIIIILVVLAIIILGVVSFIRLSARGAKKVADKVSDDRQRND